MEKSRRPIEVKCQNCGTKFMTSYPRFTCGTNCRKALSRAQENKRIETEIAVGTSRDFFEETPGCKTCGSDLIPDGLVKMCDNNQCGDYDVQ